MSGAPHRLNSRSIRTIRAINKLALEGAGDRTAQSPCDDARHRFDILWSRVGLFREGKIGAFLQELEEYERTIAQIKSGPRHRRSGDFRTSKRSTNRACGPSTTRWAN